MKLKMMTGLFLISVAMLGLSACGGDNKSDKKDGGCTDGKDTVAARPEVPADMKDKKAPKEFKADLEAGKKLYGNCATCHGADGKGIPVLGGANLTADGLADDYIYFRIVKGAEVKMKVKMNGKEADSTMSGHAKGADVSAEDYEKEVWNIIEYVKSLKK
ncbi:MAG: c-type cytochrome [Planctomycetota bacterium]